MTMGSGRPSRLDFLRQAVLLPVALGGSRADARPQPARRSSRAQRVLDQFDAIRREYEKLKAGIDDLIRVRMDLTPELLLAGEAVDLTLTARSARRPNAALEVVQGFYAADPIRHTFRLDWRRDGAVDGFRATWRWTPPAAGCYQAKWVCDVGGDIPEFRRSFAVIDRTWLVVVMNSTSHIQPRPEPDLHELGIPFSFWAELALYGARGSAEGFAASSRWARQFGDDPGLLVFMGGDYLEGDKTVFYDEPEDVQRAVIECYRKLWPLHGYPRPLRSFYSYGVGNGPMRVARTLGIDLLGALCADQNWGDGPFKINHWGMPSRPYFVSAEDFRKPGPGGSRAMVGVQQCERQTIECRDYNCVYSFEGGISYALDRYSGVSRRRVVDNALIGREIAFFETFAQCAGQSETPLMVCCGIEFNGVWPDMAAVNRRFLEYLARRGGQIPVAYTTATAAADFMRRHYRSTPESAIYLPDVYAGIVSNGKPPAIPDTMEIENSRLKAIFRHGEALPDAQYDYTQPWRYPDWGNEDIPRDKQGYVIPNTEDRFRVTPHIVDTRPFTVTPTVRDTPGATHVTLQVDAMVARRALALAVWDLPRAYSSDGAAYRLRGAQRFVAMRAPFTGNLCGIVVADLRQGRNRIELTVSTEPRPLRTLDLMLGKHTAARVFETEAGAMAYVFATGAEAEEIRLDLSPETPALIYSPDTDQPRRASAPATLVVAPGACWRIGGLTWEQLRAASAP